MKLLKAFFTLSIAVFCSCGSDLTYDQKVENYIEYTDESRTLIEQGKYSEALYYSTAAIKITDTLAPAIYLQGMAEFGLDRFEEAEENFTKVIEMEGKTSVAYKNRAKVFLKNDNSDFMDDINTYLVYHPDDEEARRMKREYLEKKGKIEAAIEEYDLVLEKDENNIELLASRGDLYLKNGDYERSVQDYERILEIDPDNEEMKLKVSGALSLMNKKSSSNTLIIILISTYLIYVALSFFIFKPLVRKKAISQIGGNLEIGKDPLIWALPILLILVYLAFFFNDFMITF